MAEKNYGNRRADDDLLKVQMEQNALSYQLVDQPDFVGTQEELLHMQALERFYMDGYPKVSDEEWDALKRMHNYQESLMAVAPSGRMWVKMAAPLPSIEKVDSLQGLRDFCARFPGQEFIVEPKLDGLTANMIYNLNKDEGVYQLDCITSRGNGRYGMRIHDHALDGVDLVGVPNQIMADEVASTLNVTVDQVPERLEIRGEAVCDKLDPRWGHVVKARKAELEAEGMLPENVDERNLVVWRSVVSGMLNRKVPANINGLLRWCEDEGIDNLRRDRMVASLVSDRPLGRRGRVVFDPDEPEHVAIDFGDGDVVEHELHQDAETMTVVAYSMSVNGVNLDIPLDGITGLKPVNEILTMDGKPSPIFAVEHDVDRIIEIARIFYGVDENGKRDLSMPRLRNEHQYAMDGIVVKLKNSTAETQGLEVRKARGNSNKMVVPKFPNDQVALKLQSELVRVKLERIERTETSLGNVTLQGILDHGYVTESGSVVQNVNLHNPHWLEEVAPWIHEGGEYHLVMAMDIIPQLLPLMNG